MYIFKQNDIVPWEGCVATVGFFDGVHAGHRFLIDELDKIAKQTHLNSVVITFDKHPRKVLQADFQPKLLTTLNEKLEQLATTKADSCFILDFTEEFSQLTAYEFIKLILVDKLNVKTLIIGHDHRFGRHREQSFDDYVKMGEELNIKMIEASQFTHSNFDHISSSAVRKALQEGKIEQANQILTYFYSFSGNVIKGNQLGRNLGFPTANIILNDKDKIVPKLGVYGVYVYIGKERFKGMMNIGVRPTIELHNEVKIEVNIFDFDEDIYNKMIKVEVVTYIREEKRFKNLIELKEQLQKDKEIIQSVI